MEYTVTVLPGDGIGPEVTAEAVRAMEAAVKPLGHSLRFQEGAIGGTAIDACGTALPAGTMRMAKGSDAVLLGAVGGPRWDNHQASVRPEDGLLAIRKGLGLFANLRPVQVVPQLVDASPLRPGLLQGVDFVVVRELTGGLYFGRPKRRWTTARGRRGVDTLAYSESEIVRVLRVGFELARGRRGRLTSVDKANVLETSRLWRELATETGRDYPGVELEHMLVDTAAMQLVRAPGRFDVIVTENTFGDILTDEASVLTGSMGMLPSASLAGVPGGGGRALGLYEPIHGSAPDIAGRGIANPIGCILSGALLLRYSLGIEDAARALEGAVSAALEAGLRCADIAREGERTLSTRDMGEAVIGLLG